MADPFPPSGRQLGASHATISIGVRTVLLSLLLLWPILYFGRPAYFPDTARYNLAGARAVQELTRRVSGLADRGEPQGVAVGLAPQSSKVQRSIPYSIFAHLLSGPGKSFVWLAVVQAGLMGWMTVMATAALAPRLSHGAFAIGSVGLAALTTAAWTPVFVIPDAFAPIFILGLLLLAYERRSFGLSGRLGLVVLSAFAISTHGSHAPIALAMLAAMGGLEALAALRRRSLPMLAGLAWATAPVVLGLAATMASLLVSYGDANVTAKRYPLALARSIEDGPARWYLDRRCAAGPEYTVCRFFSPMPRTVGDFLWGEKGLVTRASAEDMDRIRAEEPIILEAAIGAYPLHQAVAAVKNFGLQIIEFRAPAEMGVRFDRVITGVGATLDVVASPSRPFPAQALHVIQYTVVIGALAALALGLRRVTAERRALLAVLTVALLANAAVCGVLSAPVDRYQSRVIWLAPLLAWLLWVARRPASRDAQ